MRARVFAVAVLPVALFLCACEPRPDMDVVLAELEIELPAKPVLRMLDPRTICGSPPPPRYPTVRFDWPFLFFFDDETGLILAVGLFAQQPSPDGAG